MSVDKRRMELGEFLRSRRERLSPAEVGLGAAIGARRRAKGLRREEVAALSGISLPWYTSLEQGRDIRVSDQVLESLARTLRLSKDERIHLYALSGQRPPLEPQPQAQAVSPALRFMLDSLTGCPAYVMNRKMDVLAWNAAAATLFRGFGEEGDRGRNMLWKMFTEPDLRGWFEDWEEMAQRMVANFRVGYVQEIEDAWYDPFIEALAEKSPEFRAWWSEHEVSCAQRDGGTLNHPTVGRLRFVAETYYSAQDKGLAITVYTPANAATHGPCERIWQ